MGQAAAAVAQTQLIKLQSLQHSTVYIKLLHPKSLTQDNG